MKIQHNFLVFRVLFSISMVVALFINTLHPVIAQTEETLTPSYTPMPTYTPTDTSTMTITNTDNSTSTPPITPSPSPTYIPTETRTPILTDTGTQLTPTDTRTLTPSFTKTPITQTVTFTPTPTYTYTPITPTTTSTFTGTPTSTSLFSCEQVTDIPVPECNSLVDLFNSTGGSDWTIHTDWLETNTVCSWYGITCEDGHVVELTLDNNNLIGEIPPTISGLNYLAVLLLKQNKLSGAIPDSIGNMNSLINIGLSRNQLSGSIPIGLSSLSNLDNLELANNQLTGEIPAELGNLSKLTYLDLEHNALTGNIPITFEQLTSLVAIRLGDNDLSGEIVTDFSKLPDLNFLFIGDNRFSGEIPFEKLNAPKLYFLWLREDEFSGTIPPEFGTLSNLEYLILGYNNLEGTIPPELGRLSKLGTLDLEHNQLTGPIPEELGNLSSLFYFDVNHNNLIGTVPGSFGNLVNMEEFNISNNPLSGELPRELTNMGQIGNFHYEATGLCEPDTADFQAWLASIPDHQGTSTCGTGTPIPELPNLAIQFSDSAFSPDNPLPDQEVVINLEVTNLGYTTAYNVNIRLYNYALQIGTQQISEISPGETIAVQFNNQFHITGYYLIQGQVDTDNEIAESNESDNQTSRVILVGNPPDTTASIIVSGYSDCRNDVVTFTGYASYDFSNIAGTEDYPVQGGNVSIDIMNYGTYTGSYTNTQGFFLQKVISPEIGTYLVTITISDNSKSGTYEKNLIITSDCRKNITPTLTITPGVTQTGTDIPPVTLTPAKDVYIHSEDIQFSNSEPDKGEEIVINSTIHYSGATAEKNIPVRFSNLVPQVGTIQKIPISNNKVSFDDNGQINISVPWINMVGGAQLIQVEVSPSFLQYTGNDLATKLILVGDQINAEINKSAQLVVDADQNGEISPGDTLQYTIEFINDEDIPLTNGYLVDELDTSKLNSPVDISGNGQFENGVISWYMGSLESHARNFVTYKSTILPNDFFTIGSQSIINHAFLTTDQGGTIGVMNQVNFTIVNSDVIPPVTRIDTDPTDPNQNGWYNEDVHLSVQAADEDGGSGLLETRCLLDPANPPESFDDLAVGCEYSDTGGSLTGEGIHVFYAASMDQAGNKELPVRKVIQIDKTLPILTVSATTVDNQMYTAEEWTNQAVTLSFNCQDYLSGVITYPEDQVYSVEGIYQANNYVCQDAAGNSSSVSFGSIKIHTSTALIHLVDSKNIGIEGTTAKYYDTGWKVVNGVTDPQGYIVTDIPVSKGQLTFRIAYAGATKDISQNITQNSLILFQTVNVNVLFLDSGENPLANGEVKYYASGWNQFGSITNGLAVKELLPGSYSFRMIYEGATQDISQNVAQNQVITFHTQKVTVKLINSFNQLIDSGSVQFYASGWRPFGTTSSGIVEKELLPVSYTIRMGYEGATIDLAQNTAVDNVVIFQTKLVSVTLINSQQQPIDVGSVKYYASGWHDFGTTVNGISKKELLPVSYTFRMNYAGANIDQVKNIADYQEIIFQTIPATIHLINSNGSSIDNGVVQYYANGWQSYGSISNGYSIRELLPVSYTFRIILLGGSKDIAQDISSNPVITFQTGKVHSESGNTTKYYASGWRTFSQDIELLPSSYTFRFSDGTADTVYSIVGGITNNIH
jgi:hypothetical protein